MLHARQNGNKVKNGKIKVKVESEERPQRGSQGRVPGKSR